MNVIITGSSGFVGQNLQEYLKEFELNSLSLRYQASQIINVDDTNAIIHLSGKAQDLKKQQPICLIQSTYCL